jgi:hypothetical protein
MLAAGVSLEAAGQGMKITNTYADKEVWITTYKGGGQAESFCVGKGGTATKYHPWYNQGFKIRAEVMTGPACKGTKICDTDIDLKGERENGYMNPTNGLFVHQHATVANKCYISWTSKKESHTTTINNTYKDKFVWITTMELSGTGGKGNQINSGCIDPGQQRTWADDRYQIGNHWVRAEVMTGAGCKGNKVCDTTANNYEHRGKPVFVHQNAKDPNNCYIDWK